MKFLIKSQTGSLTSVMIAAGLMGAVVTGLLLQNNQTEKAIRTSQNRLNTQELMTQLEQSFRTESGCSTLKGYKLNKKITPPNIPVLGKTTITNLSYTKFTPTTVDKRSGLAEITLVLQEKDSEKHLKRKLLIPVGVDKDGIITECKHSSSQTTSSLYQSLCEGTFGSKTAGMDCQSAADLVNQIAMTEICDDLFGGPGLGKFKGEQCDLKLLNSNKMCAGNTAMIGFDSWGNLKCKNL